MNNFAAADRALKAIERKDNAKTALVHSKWVKWREKQDRKEAFEKAFMLDKQAMVRRDHV